MSAKNFITPQCISACAEKELDKSKLRKWQLRSIYFNKNFENMENIQIFV